MNDRERQNIERVRHWEDTYNNHVERMVDECYAPNCEVISMMTGFVMNGREELRAVEREIQSKQVDRKMHVLKTVAQGDTVAVECQGVFGENKFKACVFLTFNENGQIISDHTYSQDPTGVTSTAN